MGVVLVLAEEKIDGPQFNGASESYWGVLFLRFLYALVGVTLYQSAKQEILQKWAASKSQRYTLGPTLACSHHPWNSLNDDCAVGQRRVPYFDGPQIVLK